MANRLSIPPIFKTLYKDVNAPEYTPNKNKKWNLSPKTYVLIGYYLILGISIAFTTYTLRISGVATKIMNEARNRTSHKYAQSKNSVNRSSIRLTTTNGMVALLTNPDGLRVGETADDVRFKEVEDAVISPDKLMNIDDILLHKNVTAWGLLLNHPQAGTYNLELSSKTPGTYQLAIFIADANGVESHNSLATVTFTSDERSRYVFDYYPQNPSGTKLIFKNIFYRDSSK